MASLRQSVDIAKPAGLARAAARDFRQLYVGIAPRLVIDAMLLDGSGPRVVTFSDAINQSEHPVGIEDDERCLVWSAERDGGDYHRASLQAANLEEGASRKTWVAAVRPDDAAPAISTFAEMGLGAMNADLESVV
jgi:hypothetical protein